MENDDNYYSSDYEQEESFFLDHQLTKSNLTSLDNYKIQTKDCCHHYHHKKTNKIYSYDMRKKLWFVPNSKQEQRLLEMISKYK